MRLVLQVGDDAIPSAARLVEIGGFQGNALALRCAVGAADGELHPPAAVIVPEVVVGVVGFAAYVEADAGRGLFGGHALQDVLIFNEPCRPAEPFRSARRQAPAMVI
jgi:hypothetical protein